MNRAHIVSPLLIQSLLLVPGKLVLRLLCRYEVRGFEHVRTLGRRPLIFAANHASEMDPIVLLGIFNLLGPHIPLFYAVDQGRMFKKEKFGWKAYVYTDIFFKMLGAHPVYIWKRSLRMALTHQCDALSRGRSVAIFPEGRITRDGKLNEGKRGVAFLLHRSDAVVVPVAISGTYGATWKKFFSQKLNITLTVGRPVTAQDIWSERAEGELGSPDYKNGALHHAPDRRASCIKSRRLKIDGFL